MWGINLNCISKNHSEISRLQIKVMDKFQRGCLTMSKKTSLPALLWNSSITFSWSLEITNGFLEVRLKLFSHINLVQIFLKKDILLCLNEVWNLTLSTIPAFSLNYEQLHFLWTKLKSIEYGTISMVENFLLE